jgi:hypothetical protein
MEVSIEVQLPGKTQVSIQTRSLRQEAIEFVGNGLVSTQHDSSPFGFDSTRIV